MWHYSNLMLNTLDVYRFICNWKLLERSKIEWEKYAIGMQINGFNRRKKWMATTTIFVCVVFLLRNLVFWNAVPTYESTAPLITYVLNCGLRMIHTSLDQFIGLLLFLNIKIHVVKFRYIWISKFYWFSMAESIRSMNKRSTWWVSWSFRSEIFFDCTIWVL